MKNLLIFIFTITSIIASGQECPKIIEINPIIVPTEYNFGSVPLVKSKSRTFDQDECKVKHKPYKGELQYLNTPEPYNEIVKECRTTAIINDCGEILQILKVDTVVIKQNTVRSPMFGNYWTIRVEYRKTPAKNRPGGFMVSQLSDGFWITHHGHFFSKKEADSEIARLLQLYPAWCTMYSYYLPTIKNQGVYHEKSKITRLW